MLPEETIREEHSTSDRGRILILSPVPLGSGVGGVQMRAEGIAAALSAVADTTVLHFDDAEHQTGGVPRPSNPSALERLLSPTPSLVRCFRSAEFARRVHELGRTSIACFCLGLQMMQYADALPPGIPVVLDNYNVESDILERLAGQRSGLKRAYWHLQAAKLRRFERWALRRADCVIAISNADKRRFRELVPGVRAATIAPGLHLDRYLACQTNDVVPGRIVFVGALDWYVNIDAISWFACEVFPRIRERSSQASLAIIGRRPVAEVMMLAQQDAITLHADVPDVVPWLASATLTVVPLRYGSGVQTKVIEAMATAKPVVTTSVGAEGLDVQHGEHLLIADDAVGFAAACVKVLGDASYAVELGRNARERARHYSYPRLAQDVQRLVSELREVSPCLPVNPL